MDWCLCDVRRHGDAGPDIVRYRTAGVNVATMDFSVIDKVLSEFALQAGREVLSAVKEIHFYGAGLVSKEASDPLRKALEVSFPNATVMEFASDLLAAARALFGREAGVVAIIGTGSNSCLYDGEKVVRNIRSGGFILGDEGGGSVLGRMFLADYFKELVPESLAREFKECHDLDYVSAVRHVYKSEAPSKYLASFARFVFEHRENAYAAGLIDRNLRDFIERSLVRYGVSNVGVVGSLGEACREELLRLGQEYGLDFVRFLKAPIDNLVDFHCNGI